VLTRRARLPIEYAQAAATTHSVVANLEAQAQDAAPRSPTPPEQEQAEEEEDMAEESDDVRLLFERARRLGLTRAQDIEFILEPRKTVLDNRCGLPCKLSLCVAHAWPFPAQTRGPTADDVRTCAGQGCVPGGCPPCRLLTASQLRR
jgi:hypothetical protein